MGENDHIQIPEGACRTDNYEPKGGGAPYSKAIAHRNALGNRITELTNTQNTRRSTNTGLNVVTIHALGYLNLQELASEHFTIVATRRKRVIKPQNKPESTILGNPAQLVSADQQGLTVSARGTAWYHEATAIIQQGDLTAIEQSLARQVQPGSAYGSVMTFDDPTPYVLNVPEYEGEKQLQVELIPSLLPDQYEIVQTAIETLLGNQQGPNSRTQIEYDEDARFILSAHISYQQATQLVQEVPEIHDIVLAGSPTISISPTAAPHQTNLDPASMPTPTGRVAVVDTGVSQQNPWLAPILDQGHCFVDGTGNTEDTDGHGTAVAGLAAYYDAFSSQQIPSGINRIIPYKVEKNNQGFWRGLTTQFGQLIQRAVQDEVRVVNMSIGRAYGARMVDPWTTEADRALHQHDVVLVNAAGNINHAEARYQDFRNNTVSYPDYYGLPHRDNYDVRAVSPSNGTNVLSIGSVALMDPTGHPGALAGFGQASAHTRFSVNQLSPWGKPDLVEEGGNHRLVAISPTQNQYQYIAQLSPRVLATGLPAGLPHGAPGVVTTNVGTSFSAPLVAWLAGQLDAEYPHWSANLIRAAILNSAQIPNHGMPPAIQPEGLYGLGVPRAPVALQSEPGQLTYVHEGVCNAGSEEVIEFFVPTEFAQAHEVREIRATLVCNPPVDPTSSPYQLATVRPSLFDAEGKSLSGALKQNWHWTSKDHESVRHGRWVFSKRRGTNLTRQGDTEWTIKLKPQYHRQKFSMAGEPLPPVRFALVVTLELSETVPDLRAATIANWVRIQAPVQT